MTDINPEYKKFDNLEDDRGVLFDILKMLTRAPDGMLDASFVESAKQLSENSDTTKEQIHILFKEIYEEVDGMASSFVKELVNPAYTDTY